MEKKAYWIKVRGLVQGVGFRPFVYRMAHRHAVKGWVENNNEGVMIFAEATPQQLLAFEQSLRDEAPSASSIAEMSIEVAQNQGFEDFSIRKSTNLSDEITQVSPDIAVCDDCLHDMQQQAHRHDYLFTNCTHCGPRFTIIRDLPYDRHQTTMAPFVMCDQCRSEYTDILDRRFHAQPVACKFCGPQYYLLHPDMPESITDMAKFIAQQIDDGKILAVKGLGGYHLLCNAHDEVVVQTLRKRKQREGKPMAVMIQNIAHAEKYFEISPVEKEWLNAWQRPIVLVNNRIGLAPSVSNGLHTTGLVIPYMPLHHYLFRHMNTDAVVFTSANLSDEPVVMDEETAIQQLTEVADFIVAYNRAIHNRADDSVAMVVHDAPMLIRRSRGYAPSPVDLPFRAEGILATGAELNNTFALGKGHQALLSQHIGDLKNAPTLEFFEQSLQRFRQLFRFEPVLVACDLHPDYLSTQFARESGLPLVEVQHHHAHMASCMAEHGLNEPVIGIIFDGTGLGTDGTIWGGECLTGDYHSFERRLHLDPVPLPGGDKVTHQPWRTAFAYLYKYFGADTAWQIAHRRKWANDQTLSNILLMLDKRINSPLSSGVGRLFDAVAAILGQCTQAGFHAEAPMRLEATAVIRGIAPYPFEIVNDAIVLRQTFEALLHDFEAGLAIPLISSRFHETVVHILLVMANNTRAISGLNTVVLSGGSFQNRYLTSRARQVLINEGYSVFVQQKVPVNDGGIALGQLAVAAATANHG